MPEKCLSRLLFATAGLFAVYVVFLITAIYFASSATQLAGESRSREADVVALETEYYAAVSALSKANPSALGYVMPHRVDYVTALGSPTLTRADR